MPASRNDFLIDLMTALASNPAYTAVRGPDTDMTITSNPVDATWGAGTKRVEYAAALKAVELEGIVYFWEMLKERADGVSLAALESQSEAQADAGDAGVEQEAVVGPGSESWQWGYGTLRALVEDVAVRHGFAVRVVLVRDSAIW